MKHAWLRSWPVALLLAFPAYAQNPVPATSLSSSSPSLQLPGSLTLTSTVAPSSANPGMPTGNVEYFYGGTHSLGTAPLSVIPATENFLAPVISGSLGSYPFGLFTLSSGTSKYSTLGVLDWYEVSTSYSNSYYPEVTLYSGQGANHFSSSGAAPPVQINNSPFNYQQIDAYAVADFSHDGLPGILLHGAGILGEASGNIYYWLPGTSGGSFDPTISVEQLDGSGMSCSCSNPTEAITVDDFNGDGYPDVAYAATSYNTSNPIGVALNVGSAPTSPPTIFQSFKAAPTVTDSAGDAFQPEAIASGHFTASGHTDLVVAGYFIGGSGALALFLGNGDGTFTLPTLPAPATVSVANTPAAVATADFRNNGMTDVVVVSGTSDPANAAQVFWGDGQGHLTLSSTVALPVYPNSVKVADFNNDGYPDILVTGTDGSLNLLLNDGTGKFSTATAIGTASGIPSLTTTGDFNGDGLADIAELTDYAPESPAPTNSEASEYLNSASSQAILKTPPQTVPAGTDTLTATYAGDSNFSGSTSTGVPVTVTQTAATLAWPQPAAMEYGAPLSAAQLDAKASVLGSITYTPAAGTVLPPGATQVSATFVPTDSWDYTGATASQTITVAAPTLAGISPSVAKLGDGNTTITVSGQGFISGAVVEWNGTALATSWVSLNELSAVVPASLLTSSGTGTITVVDPNKVAVAGSQTFTVVAGPAVAQASAPSSAVAGQDSSITLTVSPYPVAITATLTLSFTPSPPNTQTDPNIRFTNNSTTDTIQIPANSSAAIPAISFSPGSTAGTITVTVRLTAGGADITPASLVPVTVAVPASPPVINSVTLTRSGTSMTVAILGLSSTRDMTQAHFHFTPAAGQSLKTTDLTVDLATPFGTWYGSTASDTYGTTFLYTQPFTLDSDATNVGSITVTLTNSQGDSQPGTAQ